MVKCRNKKSFSSLNFVILLFRINYCTFKHVFSSNLFNFAYIFSQLSLWHSGLQNLIGFNTLIVVLISLFSGTMASSSLQQQIASMRQSLFDEVFIFLFLSWRNICNSFYFIFNIPLPCIKIIWMSSPPFPLEDHC